MANVKISDKHIGGGIYIAASALLNKRYRDKALTIATLVNRSVYQFRKYLNFPEGITIRIAPIKGTVNGRYYNGDNTVLLDCKLDWARALEVFAHELVHAEQYHTGRLKHTYVKGKGLVHSWNGTANTNRGTTYKAYRNQPWEQEAWSRQAELAEKVCSDLERIYGE
jgi:hypothetical protein